MTVGEVSATGAVVWLRASDRRDASVEATADGVPGVVRGRAILDAEADFTGKAVLAPLLPATRYHYRVTAGRATVAGAFVTAPSPDEPRPVVFVWSGDLGGGNYCRRVDRGYPIFRTMARHRADFFLFVGDTVYADRGCRGEGLVPSGPAAQSLKEFRDKHRYNRAEPTVQAYFRGTSVYAIWDDHEVRNDFSGRVEPLMPAGRRAFLDYWPIVPPDSDPTRLYRKARWGRLLEVFVLDTRQYRSPNTEPDGPGKTMLGPVQRRWLIDEIAASSALWRVIVSSVPLAIPTGRSDRRDSWSNADFSGHPREHGTGFAVERGAIVRALRDRGVRNVIFLTADVHHAELIRHHPTHDYSFHEFIAGPLSASLGSPRPLDRGLNPRSLFARGGVNNFGEIEIDPARLTVRLIEEDGAVMFTHTIGPE